MSSRVAILDAKRTPIGKFLGAFRNHSAVKLGGDVARAAIASSGVAASDVDELWFGHARQAGNGPNPARQVSIRAGIAEGTFRDVDPERAAYILFSLGNALSMQTRHPYAELMPLFESIVYEGLLPRRSRSWRTHSTSSRSRTRRKSR